MFFESVVFAHSSRSDPFLSSVLNQVWLGLVMMITSMKQIILMTIVTMVEVRIVIALT